MKYHSWLVVVVVLLFASLTTFASPTGPVYPLPNGTPTTVVGSGDALTGTLTYNYSGFDLSPYGEVWWGPSDVTISVQGGSPVTLNPNYDSINNQIDFTGSISIHDYANNANYVTPVSLVVGAPGLTYDAAQGAWIVTGSFSSTFQWEANGTTALGPYFNSLNPCPGPCSGNPLNTNFSGGFYYTAPEPEIPELASFMLFGSGALRLAGLIRRKLLG